MRTIYLNDYEQAKAKLENYIIESKAREEMIIKALELLEPVLHYKNIDKRIVKALENNSFYSWTTNNYLFYFELILKNKTFTNGDYFERYTESFCLDSDTGKPPQALKESMQGRLEGLQKGIVQHETELKDFPKIYKEAQSIQEAANNFGNKYSYTVQNAVDL